MIQTSALLPRPTWCLLVGLRRGQMRACAVQVWVCGHRQAGRHMSTVFSCLLFFYMIYTSPSIWKLHKIYPIFCARVCLWLVTLSRCKNIPRRPGHTRAPDRWQQRPALAEVGSLDAAQHRQRERTDLSETLAHFPVSLLSPKTMLSRRPPHVNYSVWVLSREIN